LASARAETGPILLEMMPPPVPEQDNAAPIYRQAFAALTPADQVPGPWRYWAYRWTVPGQPPLDPKEKELRIFLQRQEKGLALLKKAAAMPGCSFGTRPEQWLEPETWKTENDLGHMGHAARILALDAWVRTVDGDTRTALENIKTLLSMARHTHPFFALHIVLGIEHHALLALRDLLATTTLKPQDLANFSFPDDAALVRQLKEEEAVYALLGLAFLSSEPILGGIYREISKDTALPLGLVEAFFDTTILPVYRVFLVPDELESWRHTLVQYQRLRRPPHQPPFQNWDEVIQEVRTQPGGLFTLIYLRPRIHKLARDAAEIAELRQLSRVAIALVKYRTLHSKYPDRLDQIVPGQLPGILLDPRNGKPLHYEPGPTVKLSPNPEAKSTGRGEDLVFQLR
jgi:hypothetical protein